MFVDLVLTGILLRDFLCNESVEEANDIAEGGLKCLIVYYYK